MDPLNLQTTIVGAVLLGLTIGVLAGVGLTIITLKIHGGSDGKP